MDYYKLYSDVSGSKSKTFKTASTFFSDLKVSKTNVFDAATTIKDFLIHQGFEYDERTFRLEEVITQKKANCLGLTLLIGAELLRRGFEPGFRIITRPMDAIDKQDLRLFEELCAGAYFDYNSPQLPEKQASNPQYRFIPLEHSLLVLDGKEFELTSLASQQDPNWIPPAEKRMDVDFQHLASYVLVDQAQLKLESEKFTYKNLRQLCEQAAEVCPENIAIWESLWYIGFKKKDSKLKETAKTKYMQWKADDSRYHYNIYRMTQNQKHLDIALDKYPAFIDAFFEKHVTLMEDVSEQRFNFAVAAWCVANSWPFDLYNFYKEHRTLFKKLFPEKAKSLLS